jgi:polar amino acid transport system substrate-binding protein
VRELQRRVGGADAAAAIEIQPWQRVMVRAQQEADLLVSCPKRIAPREQRFQWVGPLFISRTFIYVRADSPLRLESLEQARRLVGLMVPRASYSFEALSAQGFVNLVPTNGTGLVPLKMLMAGREPALVLEERQLEALLREAGLPPDSVRPVLLALTADSYLAFTAASEPARVARWRQALADFKREGGFERLYRQWFQERPPAELLRP